MVMTTATATASDVTLAMNVKVLVENVASVHDTFDAFHLVIQVKVHHFLPRSIPSLRNVLMMCLKNHWNVLINFFVAVTSSLLQGLYELYVDCNQH